MFDDLAHTTGTLVVDSCQVRYLRFGRADRPCLVLLHGGRAHGGWWARVVPHLAPHFDVVVPDLSGFGDSGHRDHYTPDGWASEVLALITHSGRGAASLAGHSMGGRIALIAAAQRPELVERLILVDAPVGVVHGRTTAAGHDRAAAAAERRAGRKRRYASPEAALARFRLNPPETVADPALLRELGRYSLTRDGDGWAWKFDAATRLRVPDEPVNRALPAIRCRVGVVYGERSSLVGPDTVELLNRQLGQRVPVVCVPGAYHHVPLDAPQECARAIVAVWQQC